METGDYEDSRYEKYVGTRNRTGGNPPVVKTLQSLQHGFSTLLEKNSAVPAFMETTFRSIKQIFQG